MESRIQRRSMFGIPGRVLAKCQEARRDERNGFPFSAAMEWREAAGLCASVSLLADFAGGNGNASCVCRGNGHPNRRRADASC